jgi:hypothetical protein
VGHIQNVFGSNVSSLSLVEERFISWHQPPLEFLTLDVDSSVVSDYGLGGFRSLIRDHNEIFLHWFFGYGNIWCTNVFYFLFFLFIKVCFYVGCWDPRI